MKMRNENRGKTQSDAVRICFTANTSLIEELSSMSKGDFSYFDGWTLSRKKGRYFKYVFVASIRNSGGELEKFLELKFGALTDEYDEGANKVHIWIVNKWLYTYYRPLLEMIVSNLGLEFSHITRIELAKDFKRNMFLLIRKFMSSPNVNVIINGSRIEQVDRNTDPDVLGVHIDYSTNLWKIIHPTLYINQVNAIRDKSNGLSFKAYNKVAEIVKNKRLGIDKDYILEHYKATTRSSLHRIEVMANTLEILPFIRQQGKNNSLDLLFDQEFLDALYLNILRRLLRFTNKKTRKPILWEELFEKCIGR